MGTFSIISDAAPVVVYNYCFKAYWDCEDSVHNCPGQCGYVRYYDEFGVEQMEAGYCVDDGVIQIVASSIIEAIGMVQVTCTPE